MGHHHKTEGAGKANAGHPLTEERLHTLLLEERRLIANEVHDSLAQSLTFLRMRAKLLRDSLTRSEFTQSLQYLGEIERSLSVAHSRVRDMIAHYRTMPANGGLLSALKKEVNNLNSLGVVKLTVVEPSDAIKLSSEQEAQVYYVVREALANIVKHSRARRGYVRLHHKGGYMHVEVEDDGKGINKGSDGHGHYGLNIMLERTRRMGGQLTIGNSKSGGTLISMSFPCA